MGDKKIIELANKAVSDAFNNGSEFERKRLIEKAKNWLKNNIDEDVFVKCGNVVKIMDAHDFSEYFCKVMEE